MEPKEYLDSIRRDAALFVAAARAAGVDAPVPTCPEWTVADLARHQGRVFRWMSAIIETKAQEYLGRRQFEEAAAAAEPLAWLEEGAEGALAAFSAADPDTPVWNWLAGGPAPARFWYRRLAHETAVHRVDAEAAAAASAAALSSRIEPAEFAADGIDEFLDFLPLRAGGDGPLPLSGSYHFHTTDVAGEWVVAFDDGVTIRREHAKADVAVRGAASDLELFLYNRRGSDGLEVFGDPAKVAAWKEKIRF